jgi:hypothetical protein
MEEALSARKMVMLLFIPSREAMYWEDLGINTV